MNHLRRILIKLVELTYYILIPLEIAQAHLVGVISSGPNRPEPLSEFIAAEPGVGIVTGHRMPQTRVDGGVALNALVLEKMKMGAEDGHKALEVPA